MSQTTQTIQEILAEISFLKKTGFELKKDNFGDYLHYDTVRISLDKSKVDQLVLTLWEEKEQYLDEISVKEAGVTKERLQKLTNRIKQAPDFVAHAIASFKSQ